MNIIEKTMKCWRNTKEMPTLLRMFCQGGMLAAPILFLFLVLPIAPYYVNGQLVSYGELWSSGVGEIHALFIGFIGLGAWGIAARNRFGRWFIVLAGILPAVFMTLIPSFYKYSSGAGKAGVLAEAAITSIILYACLFWIPSVKRYFNNGGTGK